MIDAPTLPEQVVALHRAFTDAAIRHAFGGALALAYCTAEPRGTRDIDVNVFLGVDRVGELLAALPAGVAVDDSNVASLSSDGQSRLWWNETPVDIFLSNHSFHDRAEANCRYVPFSVVERLPVLSCDDLAVFKAFFARPKDAVDIATMTATGSVDVDGLEQTVALLMGEHADREEFFRRVRDDAARIDIPDHLGSAE